MRRRSALLPLGLITLTVVGVFGARRSGLFGAAIPTLSCPNVTTTLTFSEGSLATVPTAGVPRYGTNGVPPHIAPSGGTIISNQFQSAGVVFASASTQSSWVYLASRADPSNATVGSASGGPVVSTMMLGGNTSNPEITMTITFRNPATGAAASALGSSISMWAYGRGNGGLQFKSYSASNVLLETKTVPATNSTQSYGTVQFTIGVVARIEAVNLGVPFQGLAIDDLHYVMNLNCSVCGDGTKATYEPCDDHNTASGDGCSATCTVETGFTCPSPGQSCVAVCGDGVKKGAEACDDHNTASGDGCSSSCMIESGFSCPTPNVACVTVCGDGVRKGAEGCDDGNTAAGDGCSATCTVESGASCNTATPNVCVLPWTGTSVCHIERGENVAASRCTGTSVGGLCSGLWEVDVAFPHAFTSVPHVLVTPRKIPFQVVTSACYRGSTDEVICRPKTGSITTSGFTLECSGSPPTGMCPGYDGYYMPGTADWIAMESKSSSCVVQSGHAFKPTCAGSPNSDGTCSSGFGFKSLLSFSGFTQAPHIIASTERLSDQAGCAANTMDTLMCYVDPTTVTAAQASVTCTGSPNDVSATCGAHNGVFTQGAAGWLALGSTSACTVKDGTAVANVCTGSTVGGTCTVPFEVTVPLTGFTAAPTIVLTPSKVSTDPVCGGNRTGTDHITCELISVSATQFRARCSGSFLTDICGTNTKDNYTQAEFRYLAIGADCQEGTSSSVAPTGSVDMKINGQDGTVSVPPGTPITLSWNAQNVLSCDTGTSPPPWGPNKTVAASGTQQLTPTQTQTYGIHCTTTGGVNRDVQDSVGVNITTVASSSSTSSVPACLNPGYDYQLTVTTGYDQTGPPPSGVGWYAHDNVCIYSNLTECLSNAVLWRKSSATIKDFLMNDCSEPGGAYTKVSQMHPTSPGVTVLRDACLWAKPGTIARDLQFGHHGRKEDGPPVDCSSRAPVTDTTTNSKRLPPPSYTYLSKTCVLQTGECFSDLCLYGKTVDACTDSNASYSSFPTGGVCSGVADVLASATPKQISFDTVSSGASVAQFLDSNGVVMISSSSELQVQSTPKNSRNFKNLSFKKMVTAGGGHPSIVFAFKLEDGRAATTDSSSIRVLMYGTGSNAQQLRITIYDNTNQEIAHLDRDGGPSYSAFLSLGEVAKVKIESLNGDNISIADLSFAPPLCSGLIRHPITGTAVDLKANGMDNTLLIVPNQSVTLTWDSVNVASCVGTTGSATWGPNKALPVTGNKGVSVAATTTYGIECTEAGASTRKVQDAVTLQISACSNKIDDDNDGKKDYPADPDCASALDDDEGNATMPIQCKETSYEASKGLPHAQGWIAGDVSDPTKGTGGATHTEGSTIYVTLSDTWNNAGVPFVSPTITSSDLNDRDWELTATLRIRTSQSSYNIGSNMLIAGLGDRYAGLYMETGKIGILGALTPLQYVRTHAMNTTDGFHSYKIRYKHNGSGMTDDTYDVLVDNQVVIGDVKRTENYIPGSEFKSGIFFGEGSAEGQGSMDVASVILDMTDTRCIVTNSSSSSSSVSLSSSSSSYSSPSSSSRSSSSSSSFSSSSSSSSRSSSSSTLPPPSVSSKSTATSLASSLAACSGTACVDGGTALCLVSAKICNESAEAPCFVCVDGAVQSSAASQQTSRGTFDTPVIGESVIIPVPILDNPLVGIDGQPLLPAAPIASVCGDGFREGGEECDDGNAVDGDGCSAACLSERGFCGDGAVQKALNEQCDIGMRLSEGLSCSSRCRIVSSQCGDGVRNVGEECDSGVQNNNRPGSRCRADCSFARCGDGIVDAPQEQCDDGNNVSRDGCSASCGMEGTILADGTIIPAQYPPNSAVSSAGATQWQPQQQQAGSTQTVVFSPHAPVGNTGPGSLAVMAAGAAGGMAFVRRRFRR